MILFYASKWNKRSISWIILFNFLCNIYPRDQRAVTHLENVRQLNIRRGKKLVFQLSHRQPPNVAEVLDSLLVLRYSRNHYGARSNRIWCGQDLLVRDSQVIIKVLSSSHLKVKRRSSLVLMWRSLHGIKTLLLTYWKYFTSVFNPSILYFLNLHF